MATHTGILRRSAARGFAVVALLLASGAPLHAGPMQEEKLWTEPTLQETIHPRLISLMRDALAEDTDLTRVKALGEIARYKMTELTGEVIKQLDDPSPVVQTSALMTLDTLDDPAVAEQVARFIQPRERYDTTAVEQVLLADRMLARWKHEPAAAVWVSLAGPRLADIPVCLRISAAHGIATVGRVPDLGAAWDDLSMIVLARGADIRHRLAAAQALSVLAGEKGEPVEIAVGVMGQGGVIGPLLAATLLTHSASSKAVDTLRKLAVDPSAAVQAIALSRLIAIDPAHVDPFAEKSIRSDDATVRRIVAEALARRNTPAAVALLLDTLDDEHPDVRLAAHASLRTLAADKTLYDGIASGLMKIMDIAITETKAKKLDRWRQAERAAMLLGEIDYKPAHTKLVHLFDHPRGEVPVAAVIGLRPLAVESTYPIVNQLVVDVLARMEGRSAEYRKQATGVFKGDLVETNKQDSALVEEAAQTLGVWRYAPADGVLRRMIPKESIAHTPARAAGIWALGMIHEDKPDAALARTLIERVYDLNPNNPESSDVRLASVVAIGRMKAVTEVKGIRQRIGIDGLDVQCAARWAFMRITGETLPEIKLDPIERSDAFIAPLP